MSIKFGTTAIQYKFASQQRCCLSLLHFVRTQESVFTATVLRPQVRRPSAVDLCISLHSAFTSDAGRFGLCDSNGSFYQGYRHKKPSTIPPTFSLFATVLKCIPKILKLEHGKLQSFLRWPNDREPPCPVTVACVGPAGVQTA